MGKGYGWDGGGGEWCLGYPAASISLRTAPGEVGVRPGMGEWRGALLCGICTSVGSVLLPGSEQ